MNPTKTIYELVQNDWDATTTSLAEPPGFNREAYNGQQSPPVITFSGRHEDVVNAEENQTGFTAQHGPSGQMMQRRAGYVVIDCVAGTVADCQGIATGGGDLDPKLVRSELRHQAQQILLDAAQAGPLSALGPGESTDMVDRSGSEPVYHHQFRARYLRDRVPDS